MSELKFHEASEIFPMDESSIDSLADDIRKNGLLNPVELYKGKILDGRRRHAACIKAGVEPEFVDVNPEDPVAYVLSQNLHRRHLTASQRAMVAARASEIYERQAKQREKEGAAKGGRASGASRREKTKGGANWPHPSNNQTPIRDESRRARSQAAATVGVGGRTVQRACRVIKNGTPEVIKAVDEGKISLNKAEEVTQEPPEVQERRVSGTEPDPDTDPEARRPRGKGIDLANDAINCLRRIPKNDALRKRGFQLVADWLRRHR